MRGRAGVCVSAKRASQAAWLEPIRDGDTKHARFVWIKRGGASKSSGSGPSGYKLNPAKVLARALAERPGVAHAVKTRQQAMEAKREAASKR